MKDALKASWIAAALALSLAACDGVGVNELGLEGEPCPCAEQWTCCENRNVCVRNGAVCPATVDAAQSRPGPDATPGDREDAAPRADGAVGPFLIAEGLAEPVAMTGGDIPFVADRGAGTLLRIHFDYGPDGREFRAVTVAEEQDSTVALGRGDTGGLYWASGADGAIMALRTSSRDSDPVVLASGQAEPVDLAVAGEHVYWVTRGAADGATGTVARIPRTGGDVEILASSLAEPSAVDVGESYVYWANAGSAAGGDTIMRVLRGGGAVETVASGQAGPTDIEFAHSVLYWISEGEGDRRGVMAMPLPGGSPVAIVEEGNPTALAGGDDSPVYYAGDTAVGMIRYDGRSTEVLATLPEASRPALTPVRYPSEGVVWANADDGTLSWAPDEPLRFPIP